MAHRGSLATTADQSVTDRYAVRDEADRSWSGDAGPALRDKMHDGSRRADELRADAERAAQAPRTILDPGPACGADRPGDRRAGKRLRGACAEITPSSPEHFRFP
ncbi:hypothetical protein Ait01nite_097570 [Actinoplanes italicus]|nr:hypothetical protein Ait01nite_097570 [Actinoplanes italicus]